MNFEPTEDQARLRQEIVRFARAELNEGAAERDRDGVFPRELWQACGRMGLTGLPVPVELGGQGADPLTTALALEAFGYGCKDGGLVFSVCAHLLACVVPVMLHGSEEARRRWLPRMSDGSTIAINGMTESESGSDAFVMRTRAERDGDGWVLNGTKIFASNGPVGDVALVYAVTDPERPPATSITA
ncbi:MAG TPA: acyl-CoA dehydrogenase family protein, partial [Longimicrobiaceae bacterium]|nr:acyl-CoA dehydrogenase family protein [Longimicrobiaceae bacterium]